MSILKLGHERAKEIKGFLYGEKENGGTGTLYVSKVPFEKIDMKLKEAKSTLTMGKVENPLGDVNGWAKGFFIGPIIGALGAIGLALYHKGKKEDTNVEKKDVEKKDVEQVPSNGTRRDARDMRIEDWRAASPDEAHGLLERERQRWLSALQWDPAAAWAVVEDARRMGTVPGFVAGAGGRIIGWTFFIVYDGILKIGALQGDTADVVSRLLEAVLDAPETRFASEYHSFLFPGHSSVEAALARRRFVLDRHAYLELRLPPVAVARPALPGAALRAWRPSDLPGLVRLASARTPVTRSPGVSHPMDASTSGPGT